MELFHATQRCTGSKPRRIAALFSLVLGAFFMMWKVNRMLLQKDLVFPEQRLNPLHRLDKGFPRRNLQASDEPRPIIYTFYETIHRDNIREERIRVVDQALLQVWKQAWTEAGWEPRILSLDNAQQHPQYQETTQALSKITLYGGTGRNRDYNEYCFMRYLAMATVGGGWMADYDTIPLSNKMPKPRIISYPGRSQQNDGIHKTDADHFTVHGGDGGIPCLLSGRAEEYTRIVESMLEVMQSGVFPEVENWSDMVALQHLYHQQTQLNHYHYAFRLEMHVQGVRDLVRGNDQENWKCPGEYVNNVPKQSQQLWALHFSHFDTTSAGHRNPSRPQLVQDYRDYYKAHCMTEDAS